MMRMWNGKRVGIHVSTLFAYLQMMKKEKPWRTTVVYKMARQPAKVEEMDAWVIRYVNKLKNMMGLSNWTIMMQAKPSSADALGETEVIHGQHLAKMYLHKDFRKDTPEDIRATIVHELLHCHLAVLEEAVHEVLKPDSDDAKAKAVHKMVISLIEYENERIIDSLAESMGKWMPVPDMPKPRAQKKIVKKAIKKQVKKKS
jgi:hypothetical protein